MTALSGGEKIRAILFDLDGTLLDRVSSFDFFLNQQYERFSSSLSGIGRQLFVQTITEFDNYGYVSKPEVYARTQDKFHLSPELAHALLDDFEINFHSLAIPFPMMHEMLQSLASNNLALGLVTNGLISTQRPKIEALGISSYFKAILISEEQGVRKPDPESYLRALRILDSTPAQSVFVGDHPDTDIAGAAKVGLKTIWKRNTCWPPPTHADAVIDGLDEIPPILAGWSSAP